MNDDEDKGFFILVLGVLAALIAVISWWYSTGAIGAGAQPIVSADSHSAADEAEPAPPAAPATVVDVLLGNDELSEVASLIRGEGLDTVLAADGPFTVFAPSNDAVAAAADSETVLGVLSNNLSPVLSYHVVSGDYSAEQLIELAADGSDQLVTVQGEALSLSLDGDDLVINGSTVVTAPDQAAENGVVHTLGGVLLPPIAALNSLVTAEPILFDTGSATIKQESIPTLDGFIEVLSASTVDITVEGHTDSTGDPVINQNLSQSRAEAVLNYLVANGIEEARLTAVGFGADNPIADNATVEGQAQNRRIEFTQTR